MSFHFLLKAEARTSSVVQAPAMTDDDAFRPVRRVRWGEEEKVLCPHGGNPTGTTSVRPARFGSVRAARTISRCRPE